MSSTLLPQNFISYKFVSMQGRWDVDDFFAALRRRLSQREVVQHPVREARNLLLKTTILAR